MDDNNRPLLAARNALRIPNSLNSIGFLRIHCLKLCFLVNIMSGIILYAVLRKYHGNPELLWIGNEAGLTLLLLRGELRGAAGKGRAEATGFLASGEKPEKLPTADTTFLVCRRRRHRDRGSLEREATCPVYEEPRYGKGRL